MAEKTETITLRMSATALAGVDAWALEEGRSRSDLIRRLVTSAMAERARESRGPRVVSA